MHKVRTASEASGTTVRSHSIRIESISADFDQPDIEKTSKLLERIHHEAYEFQAEDRLIMFCFVVNVVVVTLKKMKLPLTRLTCSQ
jgi:hypothetical protein